MALLTPVLLGLGASLATLGGGTLALRWRRRLTLILGLAAGIVLGVAMFDLLPEAIELGASAVGGRWLSAAVTAGLFCYMLINRGTDAVGGAGRVWQGHLAPATLTLHSLVDGLGIGLAFQASANMGWIVAAAVLSHDMVDGVNVVTLSLASRTERAARRWLLANSAAPLAGAILGTRLAVSAGALAQILAAFGGAFLYIGVGELLPRSYKLDPRPRTTAANLAGLVLIATVTGIVR